MLHVAVFYALITTFVAARAVHFGAAIVLFGELLFATYVAPAASAIGSSDAGRGEPDAHVRAFTGWALVASLVSGILWLVFQSADMAGITIRQALGDDTLAIVLRRTGFGHVFALRAALLVALAGALVWLRRATTDTARRWRIRAALLAAALYLAALAATGHAAAASDGLVRLVHVGSDALHLLAAGGWLGALPPLIYGLATAASPETAARLAHRFSVLGIACVAALFASGIVNSLFLVGSFAALFGTPYGQLLDVKIGLFAAMLVIATVNRFALTPRLTIDPDARRSLRRNAMTELTLGMVVVGIVGALGTMVPGAHRSPVWPFGFTLDLSVSNLGMTARIALLAALATGLAGIALIFVGVRRRARRLWLSGCAALLVSAAPPMLAFAIPAYPTTYAGSPVPYAADAVLRGATRYARECSGCHGPPGRREPLAAALSIKPPDLALHAFHHPVGTLYWWIAHGIPRTPMPAFSPRLSDAEIWEIVQFLIARGSAEMAMHVGSGIDVRSVSRVPDFTYELAGQGQQTLSGQHVPALIVLYSLPHSAPRLASLRHDHRFMSGQLRLVTIPLPGSEQSDDAPTKVGNDVTNVYRMFIGMHGTEGPEHVELLVDAAGVIRARWMGLPPEGVDRDAEIVADALRLPATSGSPASMHHGH